jgi:hypothetical protein
MALKRRLRTITAAASVVTAGLALAGRPLPVIADSTSPIAAAPALVQGVPQPLGACSLTAPPDAPAPAGSLRLVTASLVDAGACLFSVVSTTVPGSPSVTAPQTASTALPGAGAPDLGCGAMCQTWQEAGGGTPGDGSLYRAQVSLCPGYGTVPSSVEGESTCASPDSHYATCINQCLAMDEAESMVYLPAGDLCPPPPGWEGAMNTESWSSGFDLTGYGVSWSNGCYSSNHPWVSASASADFAGNGPTSGNGLCVGLTVAITTQTTGSYQDGSFWMTNGGSGNVTVNGPLPCLNALVFQYLHS